MRGTQSFLILSVMAAATPMIHAANFSGNAALEFTRHAVEFGPRPPGSDANHQLQAYIVDRLKSCACQVSEDPFTAQTPKGAIAMKNILARFPGKTPNGRMIVITGHYDTKLFPGRKFVGANDAGSSTGLLLELAQVLAHQPRTYDVVLVWFDGEEAIRKDWEGVDNLYGSRHLADRWRKDGTFTRIKALINVDMIGDKNLDIMQELNSDPGLRKLVQTTAADLGYKAYFLSGGQPTEDDHTPFLEIGVPAIDLIDFNYGPNNSYWHEDSDTMDKLSAQSLEIVGTMVVELISRLERQ